LPLVWQRSQQVDNGSWSMDRWRMLMLLGPDCLIARCGVSSGVLVLVTGHAVVEVIAYRLRFAWAVVFTARSSARSSSAFLAHGQVEGLSP